MIDNIRLGMIVHEANGSSPGRAAALELVQTVSFMHSLNSDPTVGKMLYFSMENLVESQKG